MGRSLSLQRQSEIDTLKPPTGLRKSTARLCWSLVALLGALILVGPRSFGEESLKFPVLTGRVIDEAQVLGENYQRELIAKLKALEDTTSDHLIVVTLPSLQGYSIEDYSYQLGKHWGINTELANGALLIVAPNQGKVRIEVGAGLETILTDKIAKSIIEEDILPRFRQGYLALGIKKGVDAIYAVLTRPPAPTESGRPSAWKQAAGWYDDKGVWHWASGPRGPQPEAQALPVPDGSAGWYDDKGVWHWASGPRGPQPATSAPTPKLTPPTPAAKEIPLIEQNGTLTVPVVINGVIELHFILDTGAADVVIPADVVLTLMRTGTLKERDLLDMKTYVLADGRTVPARTFRLRTLKVGDRIIENVVGSVGDVQGSPLLGQTFLMRLNSWSIDYGRHVLVLN